MKIDNTSVSMDAEEAFDLLHEKNKYLWEQVIDALGEIAQDLFSASNNLGGDTADAQLESGILFEDGKIAFKKDL